MIALRMQALILVVAFATTLVTTNSVTNNDVCPEICPTIFAPICATNGIAIEEFGNQCELQWINCRLERSTKQSSTYKEIAMDWCSTELVENLNQKLDNLDFTRPECLKPCPMNYDPICVSNGKYRSLVSNQCEMEVYNCALGLTANLFKVLQPETCEKPILS